MLTIKIYKTDNPIEHFQVQIVERIETAMDIGDDLHTVDKVTTSPELFTVVGAKKWLTKWLKLTNMAGKEG